MYNNNVVSFYLNIDSDLIVDAYYCNGIRSVGRLRYVFETNPSEKHF
jgi:hypothetical protein